MNKITASFEADTYKQLDKMAKEHKRSKVAEIAYVVEITIKKWEKDNDK